MIETVTDTALDLRAKMLGVLLRDARDYTGRAAKECAEAMGVTIQTYNAYERGEKSPTLPELELLAYSLDVPLQHFWGATAISEREHRRPASPGAAITEIRDRMIGARLRQARLGANLKSKELAGELGISAGLLASYEFGQTPIPLPDLEVILHRLGLQLEDVLESSGVVGDWESAGRLFERFKQLPPELREFVTQPMNEHYLRLAQRLSQMPADHLRAIATGLLDITY
ncbi:MAG: helix-turn-helix domain-containing protein [Anaerolineales bacterium]